MPTELDYTQSAGFTYQLQKIKYFIVAIQKEIEDTNYIWTLDDNGDVTLVYYLGLYKNIKVPIQIEGHPVKYIGEGCYSYNTNLVSVTIPEGIVTIG